MTPTVESQLREIIEQITPVLKGHHAPAVRQQPVDPHEREAWFADVARLRATQQAGTVEMIRAATAAATAVDGVEVGEVRIPVTGTCGWAECPDCRAGSVSAIVYRPAGLADVPVYLHFHGGGFWVGGGDVLRAAGAVHATRARELGVVVVDVDYRMAPEHKYPLPVADCYAALSWTVAHAAELGADPARVAVGGGSAGATLAAGVTLMSRDRGGPAIAGQVLTIPAIDSSCSSQSLREFAEGYVMTRSNALEMWDMYLASPADAHESYASPAHATDLSGLPPALVVLGDYDVLRDEGIAYARRLVDDGVTVTMRRFPQAHGAALPEVGPATERLIDEFLRVNLL